MTLHSKPTGWGRHVMICGGFRNQEPIRTRNKEKKKDNRVLETFYQFLNNKIILQPQKQVGIEHYWEAKSILCTLIF